MTKEELLAELVIEYMAEYLPKADFEAVSEHILIAEGCGVEPLTAIAMLARMGAAALDSISAELAQCLS